MKNLASNNLEYLSDFTLLLVNGADASCFLQGQLTADINKLSPKHALLTACCDHKGRMIANFWLWPVKKGFQLMLPKSTSELLLNHLKKYAVFSKVKIQEMEDLHFFITTDMPEEIQPGNEVRLLQLGHLKGVYLIITKAQHASSAHHSSSIPRSSSRPNIPHSSSRPNIPHSSSRPNIPHSSSRLSEASGGIHYHGSLDSLRSLEMTSGKWPLEMTSGEWPLEMTSGEWPLEMTSGEWPLEMTSGEWPLEMTSGEWPLEMTNGEYSVGMTSGECSGERKRGQWERLFIENGIALLLPATSGKFTPQMIDLQLQGGVSFKKGCYVGQEVIARTEHLGKLKRHLYQFKAQADSLPQPGDALLQHQQPVGMIINAVSDSNKEYIGLAVIEDRALKEGLYLEENHHKIKEIIRVN